MRPVVRYGTLAVLAFGGMAAPERLAAQRTADSVVVVAATRYKAGGLYRHLFGDAYRELWATPIKVPILNLRTYAGGLHALKAGGGNQTRSLRLVSPRGQEYAFRPVFKAHLANLGQFEGTYLGHLMQDAQSDAPPAAPLLASLFLKAVHVLRPLRAWW